MHIGLGLAPLAVTLISYTIVTHIVFPGLQFFEQVVELISVVNFKNIMCEHCWIRPAYRQTFKFLGLSVSNFISD